jgi:hypothetical protein
VDSGSVTERQTNSLQNRVCRQCSTSAAVCEG